MITHKEQVAGVVVLYRPDQEVWDNVARTVNCLGHLYLVDNTEKGGGLEDTMPWDATQATYLPLGENRGLATALNIGVQAARADGFEWVLTLDQDSTLDASLLEAYFESLQKADPALKIGCVCPQYVIERKSHNTQLQQDQLVYWSMQSACMYPVDVLAAVGPFADELFIDCVDYEYCLRMRRDGYHILQCAKAVLHHKPAQAYTTKLLFLKPVTCGIASPIRYYYQVRNSWYLWRRYHCVRAFGIMAVKFAKTALLFPHKSEYFHKMFRGLRDGIRGVYGPYSDGNEANYGTDCKRDHPGL